MKMRACVGITALIAFFAALILASAPHLHDQFHPTGAKHECAATMIRSGNCEHNTSPEVAPAVENAPNSPAFLPRRFQFVVASVPSSIQEHAPPATR